MSFNIIRSVMLAAFAIVPPALPAFAFTAANISTRQAVDPAVIQVAADRFECRIDDGYGRYKPCSSYYKTAHPNWRAGSDCFTDEGYGRYRPCNAFFKGTQSKN